MPPREIRNHKPSKRTSETEQPLGSVQGSLGTENIFLLVNRVNSIVVKVQQIEKKNLFCVPIMFILLH